MNRYLSQLFLSCELVRIQKIHLKTKGKYNTDYAKRTAKIYTSHFWIFRSIWDRIFPKSVFSVWVLIT
jgi:hypothetical protein